MVTADGLHRRKFHSYPHGIDPASAYLPFDRRAAGHVPGEGGAILILEGREAALSRGARIYGEIAGCASGFDPKPGSGRPPALGRTIDLALLDAGLRPSDVDAVFADGAAIPELDRAEAETLRSLFGSGGIPVTVPKTMIGHLYSGAGPLDLATAFLAMEEGLLPPTVNSELAGDYDLDLVVGQPRPGPLRTVLVLSRGYGGFNSAIVVRSAG